MLHILISVCYVAILLALSSHVATALIPLDSRLVAAALGTAVALAASLGGFSASLNMNLLSSIVVFVLAFLIPIAIGIWRDSIDWHLIESQSWTVDFIADRLDPLSAAALAIPLALQAVLGAQTSFQYLCSNGRAAKGKGAIWAAILFATLFLGLLVVFCLCLWSALQEMCVEHEETQGDFHAAFTAIRFILQRERIPGA